jgi:hypothetical protein
MEIHEKHKHRITYKLIHCLIYVSYGTKTAES